MKREIPAVMNASLMSMSGLNFKCEGNSTWRVQQYSITTDLGCHVTKRWAIHSGDRLNHIAC